VRFTKREKRGQRVEICKLIKHQLAEQEKCQKIAIMESGSTALQKKNRCRVHAQAGAPASAQRGTSRAFIKGSGIHSHTGWPSQIVVIANTVWCRVDPKKGTKRPL